MDKWGHWFRKEQPEFYEYARAGGQVLCFGGHEWWLGAHPCPWCKAAV